MSPRAVFDLAMKDPGDAGVIARKAVDEIEAGIEADRKACRAEKASS